MVSNNHEQKENSAHYLNKKNQFRRMLTIYGRKPVLEALQNHEINFFQLHLADSNKSAKILDEIKALAADREIPVKYHSKVELSRISQSSKQDQGIAADLNLKNWLTLEDFKQKAVNPDQQQRYLILDNIHNPQNLGMVIRSAAAGGMNGVFIPEKGCAKIGPLCIKASAGSVFKCPIIRGESAIDCVNTLKKQGASINVLDLNGELYTRKNYSDKPQAFVLGNETTGVSNEIISLADHRIRIELANEIESLNVAVTAGIISFLTQAVYTN